jgi:Protein of unknown function (DUF3800)
MHFFIDEGGTFTPNAGWSIVCSLALPHKEVGPARREIDFRSRQWPRRECELKGGALSAENLIELVDILFRRGAVLHVCGIDVAQENADEIARHKANQAEGITRYLVPTHHPRMVTQVWELRNALERMSTQLYVQCVVMSELIATAVQETLSYFAQRRPRELARFQWTVDAKDPVRVSPQEAWWRDTLAPLQESRTRRVPMHFVTDPDFNYRYFDRNFSFEKDMWYPDRPRDKITGYDIKKMISDQIAFVDSRSETLIQAVDILTSFMRRVLSGVITDATVIEALGRLQILRTRDGKPQSVNLVTMSPAGSNRSVPWVRPMALAGRQMMRPKPGEAA